MIRIPVLRSSLALALAAALGLLFPGSTYAASTGVVNVEEWNKSDGSQGITVAPTQIHAGKITFEVHNISQNEVHELLIVKTNSPPETFPTEADNPARIDEEKLAGVEELPHDLQPGQSSTMTMLVTPGRYVLLCNQPGHFHAGMHTILTVVK